jgi:hypothetical protein
VRFAQIEAQRDGAANGRCFQKTTARKFHETPPDRAGLQRCSRRISMSSDHKPEIERK